MNFQEKNGILVPEENKQKEEKKKSTEIQYYEFEVRFLEEVIEFLTLIKNENASLLTIEFCAIPQGWIIGYRHTEELGMEVRT